MEFLVYPSSTSGAPFNVFRVNPGDKVRLEGIEGGVMIYGVDHSRVDPNTGHPAYNSPNHLMIFPGDIIVNW